MLCSAFQQPIEFASFAESPTASGLTARERIKESDAQIVEVFDVARNQRCVVDHRRTRDERVGDRQHASLPPRESPEAARGFSYRDVDRNGTVGAAITDRLHKDYEAVFLLLWRRFQAERQFMEQDRTDRDLSDRGNEF
jgi:hypothetical protein